MSKSFKRIIIPLVVFFSVLALCLLSSCGTTDVYTSGTYKLTKYDSSTSGDRIHFLNTGSSDAILIESDGKFAMVDGGEDTEFPEDKPGLDLVGYEKEVISYLKEVAGDKDGKVKLEFVVGTHAHSDHIGGFDTIILDDDIEVTDAYLMRYDEKFISKHEVKDWDNKEVYEQMVNACNTKDVNLIQDFGNEGIIDDIKLGNFDITIVNGIYDGKETKKKGLNEFSLGVLVEKGAQRAFLAGDINNHDGDENYLGDYIGEVDILKLGHHGHRGSTSSRFLKKLNPSIAVATGPQIYNTSLVGQLKKKKIDTFISVPEKGIVIEFAAAEFKIYNEACPWETKDSNEEV